jgi:hypothetical protein
MSVGGPWVVADGPLNDELVCRAFQMTDERSKQPVRPAQSGR